MHSSVSRSISKNHDVLKVFPNPPDDPIPLNHWAGGSPGKEYRDATLESCPKCAAAWYLDGASAPRDPIANLPDGARPLAEDAQEDDEAFVPEGPPLAQDAQEDDELVPESPRAKRARLLQGNLTADELRILLG